MRCGWSGHNLCSGSVGRETRREHCFDVHMSTSANQNTKKHLDKVKKFEKSDYAFSFSL
jgi:hypothetical protein